MTVPKQFDGPTRARLREALLNAFPSPLTLNAVWNERLNRNFYAIAPPLATYDEQLAAALTTANA